MISCSKYHGCGNDFIILTAQDVQTMNKKALVCHLCDRHQGIGADGCIIVHQNPLMMEFYNKDGSTASMCGNGLRCFAKYVYDEGICTQKAYTVQTAAGIMKISVDRFHPFWVSIHLPKPSLNPCAHHDMPKRLIWKYPLTMGDTTYTIDTCFCTTVHTILYVPDVNDQALTEIGRLIHEQPIFPAKTNVNFVQILDEHRIRVMTYERGVGKTLACGSGCCAAVWDAHRHGYVENDVRVALPCGFLQIQIHQDETITMQGDAKRIMKGKAMCI